MVSHDFDWAITRVGRKCLWQKYSVPQGSHLGPGVADLTGSADEARWRSSIVEREWCDDMKEPWFRSRWMDDVIVCDATGGEYGPTTEGCVESFYENLSLVVEPEAPNGVVVHAGIVFQIVDGTWIRTFRHSPNVEEGTREFQWTRTIFQSGGSYGSKSQHSNKIYSMILMAIDGCGSSTLPLLGNELNNILREYDMIGASRPVQSMAIRRLCNSFPELAAVAGFSFREGSVLRRSRRPGEGGAGTRVPPGRQHLRALVGRLPAMYQNPPPLYTVLSFCMKVSYECMCIFREFLSTCHTLLYLDRGYDRGILAKMNGCPFAFLAASRFLRTYTCGDDVPLWFVLVSTYGCQSICEHACLTRRGKPLPVNLRGHFFSYIFQATRFPHLPVLEFGDRCVCLGCWYSDIALGNYCPLYGWAPALAIGMGMVT